MSNLDQYRHHIAAIADMLKAQGYDDEQLLIDTIEGETDALEAISRLMQWAGEGASMAEGLKAYEADIKARRTRYEARKDAAKKAIARFMDDAGLKKLERPEGTISISAGKTKVVYAANFDAAALPEKLRRVKYEPDAAALKDWLECGEQIDGASLSNAEPVVTWRVK